MNVFDAIGKRRSIRNYLAKTVEEDKLTLVLEAAREAPSASNRQEGRFIIVRDKNTKDKLCQAAKNQAFVREAPVIIVCCAETDNHIMTCGQPCYIIDLAIAIDHMTLAAVEVGLGTCWIGAFYQEEVKTILNIPDEIKVVEMLALGYPAKEPSSPKKRLDLEKIVFSETWPASK